MTKKALFRRGVVLVIETAIFSGVMYFIGSIIGIFVGTIFILLGCA